MVLRCLAYFQTCDYYLTQLVYLYIGRYWVLWNIDSLQSVYLCFSSSAAVCPSVGQIWFRIHSVSNRLSARHPKSPARLPHTLT